MTVHDKRKLQRNAKTWWFWWFNDIISGYILCRAGRSIWNLNAASCKSIFQLLMTLSSNGLLIYCIIFFKTINFFMRKTFFKSRNKYWVHLVHECICTKLYICYIIVSFAMILICWFKKKTKDDFIYCVTLSLKFLHCGN